MSCILLDVLGSPACSCIPYLNLPVLSTYNLITLGDFNCVGDIQGVTIICDSILNDNANVFGGQLNSFPVSQYALQVVNVPNTAASTVKVQQGSVGVGCATSAVSYSNGIQYLVNTRIFEVSQYNNGARLTKTCDVDDTCQSLQITLPLLSTTLANLVQLAANSIYISPVKSNTLIIEVNAVDCNNVAVFTTTCADTIAKANLAAIEIQIAPALSNVFLIITISDQEVVWPSSVNLVGQWVDSTVGRQKTLWHFPNADTITYDSTVKGYTFAPKATLILNANTEGSVAVNKLDANAQVHLPNLVAPDCGQIKY